MIRISLSFLILVLTFCACTGPARKKSKDTDGSVDSFVHVTLKDTDENISTFSDTQIMSDVFEECKIIADCSKPPENCGLADGQAMICSGMTGAPEEIWAFWNVEECKWLLYADDWPDSNGVVTRIDALNPRVYLDIFECVDVPPKQ